MQVEGLLTGKFTLHAQTPTIQAGKTDKAARMIYLTTGGTLKLLDAKAAFTDVMETFDDTLQFNTNRLVTPDLPTDWMGNSVIIPAGVPITLTVRLALVAEVSVTRDNQFKASVGAFAKATASVGVYVFSKLTKPCTARINLVITFPHQYLPNSNYESICLDVLKDASVTEDSIESCTVPSGVQGLSGSCSSSLLVLQKRTGPDVETGFSSPTLTAANKANVVFGVGFYPMYVEQRHSSCACILKIVRSVRLSIFGEIFRIYLAANLEATVTAQAGALSCGGGISIGSEFA